MFPYREIVFQERESKYREGKVYYKTSKVYFKTHEVYFKAGNVLLLSQLHTYMYINFKQQGTLFNLFVLFTVFQGSSQN